MLEVVNDNLQIDCLVNNDKRIGTVYRISNRKGEGFVEIRLTPKKTRLQILSGADTEWIGTKIRFK